MTGDAAPTAALLVIGDEILSGQTKDRNIGFLAESLTDLGIDLEEVRIVPDRKEAIVAAVRALSSANDIVLTTGGIGPTHDDITADAIAAAFGVPVAVDPRAVAVMQRFYAKSGAEMTEGRLRMARIPEGATLIDNPVSAAPGFTIGNVHVLAGVPAIMQAMFDGLAARLPTGARILRETIEAGRGESLVATLLEAVQEAHAGVRIGSYPYHDGTKFTTRIVVRSRDRAALEAARNVIADGLAALDSAT